MKYLVALCVLFSALSGQSQKLNPVSWTFEIIEEEDALVLRSTAVLESGWAIYSQHTDPDGPVPLTFQYDASLTAMGDTEELSEPIKKMSKLFDVEVVKFVKEAVFEQKFEKQAGLERISGELRYMCCDDMRCLPPTIVPFDVAL